MPLGEAGRDDVRVTADAETYLLLCTQADDGSTGALALRLPAPEDANAIHMSLMQVQRALIDDTISAKKAGLLLYSLQLAMTNVGRTTFGQADDDELVMEVVDEEQALSKERGLPLICTDDTDKKGLPRIDADERGLGAFTANGTKEEKDLPLICTDDSDKKRSQRIYADEGGLDADEAPKEVTMRM